MFFYTKTIMEMNAQDRQVLARFLLQDIINEMNELDDQEDNQDALPRNGEQNDVVSSITLANVYISLFPRALRTPDFLKLFTLCFGNDSYICSKYPQPVMCKDCINKYIKNCNSLMECSMNDEVVKLYKSVILPRFVDLLDMIDVINEFPLGTSSEEAFMILGIDNTPYDPPTAEMMAKCEKYKFVKEEKEKVEGEDCCAICMCDMEEGEDVHKLVCKHFFHEACVGQWLKDNATCPICKFVLK